MCVWGGGGVGRGGTLNEEAENSEIYNVELVFISS